MTSGFQALDFCAGESVCLDKSTPRSSARIKRWSMKPEIRMQRIARGLAAQESWRSWWRRPDECKRRKEVAMKRSFAIVRDEAIL
jgi:hypothetical protein